MLRSMTAIISAQGLGVKRAARGLLAAAAALFAFGVTRDTQALPLLTLSANLRGLYGTPTRDQEVKPYGGGIGLSAGVTLPASLYPGASFDYFFGETEETQLGNITLSSYQLMADLGYDLSLALLTLRPSLGVGVFHLDGVADTNNSAFSAGGSDSPTNLLVSPGAELLLGLGLWSVSAEARFDKVFARDGYSDGIFVGAGLGLIL